MVGKYVVEKRGADLGLGGCGVKENPPISAIHGYFLSNVRNPMMVLEWDSTWQIRRGVKT
jgi:hypothetical protein